MTSKIFGDDGHESLRQRAHVDLIVCLMDVMPDQTISAFSRTCRLLHGLAKPQMKRRKLRFQYTDVILPNDHVSRLFELLEEQPEALRYVKTLSCRVQVDFAVDVDGRELDAWREDFCRVQRSHDNDILPLVQQLYTLPYIRGLSDSERMHLETRNETWKDTIVLASSMLCPNLEALRIESTFANMARAMTPIARYMQNIEDDQSGHNQANTVASRMVSKPKWLTLSGEFDNIKIFDILRIFSLPSFQRATVSDVIFLQLPNPLIIQPDTGILESNIKRLTLNQCDIRPLSLTALIKHMPNLEWLRYHDMNEFDGYTFQPTLPLQNMGMSARDSLHVNRMLGVLRGMRYHESDGIDAYAKQLSLHMTFGASLGNRHLQLYAVADPLLDWDRPSIIVKKPDLSIRDIGYGTLEHPRFL